MKKRIATVGLYSGFFSISFALCLFLTFDARILASMLDTGARQGNVKLAYEQARMSGLVGLDLRGVEISSLNRPGDKPFLLRRLQLSPSLSALPGILLDLRKKRPPRLAFSFSGWLGEGQRNIEGKVKMIPPGMRIDLDLANLPVDQLPTGMIPNFPPLSGKLNGKLNLDLKDRQKPATWDVALKTDIFQAKVAEFTFSQVITVSGFSLGNVHLDLDLTGGKGSLKSLRLQEGDLLVDLTGSFVLPETAPFNPGAIQVKLTGTLDMSPQNKQKLPLLATVLPPNGRLNYSGELRAISPMLQAGPMSAPGPGREPSPAREPAPEVNPDDIP